MAVDGPEKASYDFDDEEEPFVVKRNNSSASKQNQLNPQAKKPQSLSHNSNGQGLNAQKGKTSVPSSKVLPVKSAIGSPKASTSSAKSSSMKSPLRNLKSSSSGDDQAKQVSKQNATNAVKEEINPVKHESEVNSDSDDSEDNLPLSMRLKDTSINGSKRPCAPACVKPEDSDDDNKPLSSRAPTKSSAGTSDCKPVDSSKNKLLAMKVEQNGSTTKDKQVKSSVLPSKRPMDKANSGDQSAKKPKLSNESSSVKFKQVTGKAVQRLDDDDNVPISQRMKKLGSSDTKSSSSKKASNVVSSSSKKIKKPMKNSKYSKSTKLQPGSTDGQRKWTTLVHNGVIFPPPYKPHGIKIFYKGKPIDLTPEQEEVATMFAVMKDTDYMQKPKFLENFWNDWRKILGKNHVIQKLEDCDFTPIYEWHQMEKEKKKQMSSDEKKALKEEKLQQEEKYMWATVDGVKEKVGNFRVEPPGLFRGRGEHPKMGKLKSRIRPSDITINIGKDAPVPECPIPGERFCLLC
uniref:Uncharacterized protein MANES_03G135300 n=1 Tax=Rhizophora mucronata TaxID=61149 RepID=A0A2P2LZ60_RHIMU